MSFKVKSKTSSIKKTPKTREVFVVQGNYGSGWEDVTEETCWVGGKNRLHEYRENERGYPHRLIARRVPYFKLSKIDEEANAQERKDYLERTSRRKSK